jgi:hypothetical protein
MRLNELITTLVKLGNEKPIFHNETEFQRTLQLKLNAAGYSTERERRTTVNLNGKTVPIRVDIIAERDNIRTAIELKYIVSKTEVLHLKFGANWGTNMSRFGIFKDLHRVGQLVAEGQAHRGYSVSIVNISDAWSENTLSKTQLGKRFSLHTGRALAKEDHLIWNGKVHKGNVGVRGLYPYVPIIVPASQKITWHKYSSFPAAKPSGSGEFKFLILCAQDGDPAEDYRKPTETRTLLSPPPTPPTFAVRNPKRSKNLPHYIKDSLCISGHPKFYWGLRMSCGKGKANGGNYWGNVSNGKSGPGGIVALAQPALDAISDAGGDFEALPNFAAGPNSRVGGGNNYAGHVPFGTPLRAFTYLAEYFDLCACPDAIDSLQESNIAFVNPCA